MISTECLDLKPSRSSRPEVLVKTFQRKPFVLAFEIWNLLTNEFLANVENVHLSV